MNTDDIRNLLGDMRDAHANIACDLNTLRVYLAQRYGDTDPDPLAYLSKGRATTREQQARYGTTYEWEGRFWDAWHAIHDLLQEYDTESDEITQIVYEEALADGEPWAEEAYEHRIGG